MAYELFQQRMSREIGSINKAINGALAELPEPCRPVAAHILEAGGKRMRPMLTVLCARMLGYAGDDIYVLASSMELLHAATLLHDDVLDNAASRRGKPAAHTVFGLAQAILAGDGMLALGNSIVAAFGKTGLTLCYSKATSQTAAGEILEMSSLKQPELSHDRYLEIARGKTACLISQSCALGAIAASASQKEVDACITYGENLGIAFQLVDDALDFAPESQTGKPCGGDLREGKMTPPLRLYRQSLGRAERADFDAAFSGNSFSDADIKRIAGEVSAFADETRQLAGACLEKACAALELLPECDENLILRQMADYVGARRK